MPLQGTLSQTCIKPLFWVVLFTLPSFCQIMRMSMPMKCMGPLDLVSWRGFVSAVLLSLNLSSEAPPSNTYFSNIQGNPKK